MSFLTLLDDSPSFARWRRSDDSTPAKEGRSMRELKQSTPANVMAFMVLSSDHVTGATGKTLAITASKDGAAFAAVTPIVTERGSGWYNVALTAAHTDTLGELAFNVTAADCDPTDFKVLVVANVESDTFARIGAAGAGLTALGDTRIANLDAAVSTRSTFAGGAVASVAGSVGSVVGNVGGNVVGSVATVTGAVALTAGERTTLTDVILARSFQNVESTAGKDSLAGMGLIATNSSISGTTLTTRKVSDDTALHTYTLTIDSEGRITGVT